MRFLIDAQLPRRLVYCLREVGFEALHTLDLPHGNQTQDGEINECASSRRVYKRALASYTFVLCF